jgi:hypothetical protein
MPLPIKESGQISFSEIQTAVNEIDGLGISTSLGYLSRRAFDITSDAIYNTPDRFTDFLGTTTTTTVAPTTTTAAPTTTTAAPTTTTAAPTTTTAAPIQSWLAERNDSNVSPKRVGPYSEWSGTFGIGSSVLVDDGSGICWTLQEESTAEIEFTITGICP